MKNKNYISPEIEVIEVQIEQGFASSGNLDNPGFGGNI